MVVFFVYQQSGMALTSFLDDQHRLVKAVGTWWNLYCLRRCSFTLLAFHKCRHPIVVRDAWLWVLEVDRRTLYVPGCLSARVAHALVDSVASGTLDLAPTDVNLVRCLETF